MVVVLEDTQRHKGPSANGSRGMAEVGGGSVVGPRGSRDVDGWLSFRSRTVFWQVQAGAGRCSEMHSLQRVANAQSPEPARTCTCLHFHVRLHRRCFNASHHLTEIVRSFLLIQCMPENYCPLPLELFDHCRFATLFTFLLPQTTIASLRESFPSC